MYTPIVQPADLASVAYAEVINEITRNDGGALATEAIATAIQEVKMYLTRYDIVQLFGDGVSTSATFTDVYLTRIVKDVAMWHLIELANPNINYEAVKDRYDQAIESLKRIQKGLANPLWPYMDNANTSPVPTLSDQVTMHSKPPYHTEF
jgi:hypothetical protein